MSATLVLMVPTLVLVVPMLLEMVVNVVSTASVLFLIVVTSGEITFKMVSTSAKFTLIFSAERETLISSGFARYEITAYLGYTSTDDTAGAPLSGYVNRVTEMAGNLLSP